MLVPDIEALCTFLGIARATLLTYEKQRGSSWQDFIKQTKNAIAACKKELAFHQQIPASLIKRRMSDELKRFYGLAIKGCPIVYMPDK